jgi:hypothetical protein
MIHDPRNAVALIRLMEPLVAAIGYHTALTGSVLYTGGSDKDTDIIIYPHDPKHPREDQEIMTALAPLGITGAPIIHPNVVAHYALRNVWRCEYQNRRIDLFFL